MQTVRVLAVVFGLVALTSAAHAAPRAGVAAAVRGRVTLEREGSVGEAVQTGAPIFIGDEISTGPDSGLQIMLLDQTVFTLGPNSAMLIDEFVFDPASKEGQLDAELVRGAFRFISGRIAKQDPDKMKVKLPSGTIGIRGTMVDVQVDPTQGRALVLLAGPGETNTAGVNAGHIRVENLGVAQDVTRSGWGVEIPDAGSPPSEPFAFPPAMLEGFAFETTAGSPPPGNGKPNGPQPGADPNASGDGDDATGSDEPSPQPGAPAPGAPQPTPSGDTPPPPPTPTSAPLLAAGATAVVGLEGAQLDQQFDGTRDALGQLTEDPAQLMLTETTDGHMEATKVITSLSDLALLTTLFNGHFLFELNDLALSSGGNLDLIVDLDLVNQVVGVQMLDVVSSRLGTTGFGAGATSVPFSSGIGGNASFVVDFLYFDSGSELCGSQTPCNAKTTLDFLNEGTLLASLLRASASISDSDFVIEERTAQTEVAVTSRSGSEVQTQAP